MIPCRTGAADNDRQRRTMADNDGKSPVRKTSRTRLYLLRQATSSALAQCPAPASPYRLFSRREHLAVPIMGSTWLLYAMR